MKREREGGFGRRGLPGLHRRRRRPAAHLSHTLNAHHINIAMHTFASSNTRPCAVRIQRSETAVPRRLQRHGTAQPVRGRHKTRAADSARPRSGACVQERHYQGPHSPFGWNVKGGHAEFYAAGMRDGRRQAHHSVASSVARLTDPPESLPECPHRRQGPCFLTARRGSKVV